VKHTGSIPAVLYNSAVATPENLLLNLLFNLLQ
jgi:hypothetical protein